MRRRLSSVAVVAVFVVAGAAVMLQPSFAISSFRAVTPPPERLCAFRKDGCLQRIAAANRAQCLEGPVALDEGLGHLQAADDRIVAEQSP